jgi:Protein of unknown function (DUF1493)
VSKPRGVTPNPALQPTTGKRRCAPRRRLNLQVRFKSTSVGTVSPDLSAFVHEQLGLRWRLLTPATRLQTDLGVDGDDGTDFMVAFASRFKVDISAFQVTRYFGPEASWNPVGWLWYLFFGTRLTDITMAMLQQTIDKGAWPPSRT